jgi:hypothetical protein
MTVAPPFVLPAGQDHRAGAGLDDAAGAADLVRERSGRPAGVDVGDIERPAGRAQVDCAQRGRAAAAGD